MMEFCCAILDTFYMITIYDWVEFNAYWYFNVVCFLWMWFLLKTSLKFLFSFHNRILSFNKHANPLWLIKHYQLVTLGEWLCSNCRVHRAAMHLSFVQSFRCPQTTTDGIPLAYMATFWKFAPVSNHSVQAGISNTAVYKF